MNISFYTFEFKFDQLYNTIEDPILYYVKKYGYINLVPMIKPYKNTITHYIVAFPTDSEIKQLVDILINEENIKITFMKSEKFENIDCANLKIMKSIESYKFDQDFYYIATV